MQMDDGGLDSVLRVFMGLTSTPEWIQVQVWRTYLKGNGRQIMEPEFLKRGDPQRTVRCCYGVPSPCVNSFGEGNTASITCDSDNGVLFHPPPVC